MAALAAILLTWLLVVRRPDFHVRYTIFPRRRCCCLFAGGVAAADPAWLRHRPGRPWQRVAPALLLALLLAANGLALRRLYTDAGLHKPDFSAGPGPR